MIAESLTSKPGIREHNRHFASIRCEAPIRSLLKVERTYSDWTEPPLIHLDDAVPCAFSQRMTKRWATA